MHEKFLSSAQKYSKATLFKWRRKVDTAIAVEACITLFFAALRLCTGSQLAGLVAATTLLSTIPTAIIAMYVSLCLQALSLCDKQNNSLYDLMEAAWRRTQQTNGVPSYRYQTHCSIISIRQLARRATRSYRRASRPSSFATAHISTSGGDSDPDQPDPPAPTHRKLVTLSILNITTHAYRLKNLHPCRAHGSCSMLRGCCA